MLERDFIWINSSEQYLRLTIIALDKAAPV